MLAITLNGEGLTAEELKEEQASIRAATGLPVVRPLEEGVAEVVEAILNWKQ